MCSAICCMRSPMPAAGCRPVQFHSGALSACLTLSGADAAGCKSDWDAEDEAADAPFSFVLSSLLGERAASMIAASHKGSDDVLFFILLFPILKRPSENLPFHFSDGLLLIEPRNPLLPTRFSTCLTRRGKTQDCPKGWGNV